ncbi:phosphatidylinositol alpha 1,6-mannosyltransferase [Actinomycetospora succinea]|uniref:Phosphatidylinositol alpha 1,6-mannosyltransferase n=1 Tax=Actinomycetospora succinea TaxID=663603 RepID=A0A4R6VMD0_9PSEU|nr:glycosyltransferase family 1 protein [Actinomycetospora succinea]TDQ63135.1 phosphatidylinositol alpha 1,6-mannosyltransferase [Actinomycetospora succinea]
MRVAVVTESFLPAVNGVTNSVLQVVAHLQRRGHSAMVIAPGAGPDEVPGAPHVPVVRVPAVDVPGVDSLPVGVPTPAVRAALEEFRPDVVHLASPFVLGARALTVARRLRVPSVAVYQTDVAGFASSYGVGLTARAAWRWIRRLHSGASRTLAPSRWAVDALESHGVPRVHRWGRGVDTTRFHPDRRDDALRAELAPHGEMLVGYVGRLAPEKQVERLATLEGLPGVRVVVVGDGPSRARLGELLPSAHFLGFRGGTELAEAYASFDAFVHTGPHETFCQAVQEAQASGLPVLAPDAGGVADLVDPGRTGWLYDPASPTAGAEIVGRVAAWRDDPESRHTFGAAGRRRVAGRTWPSVCEELLGHYAAVIAGDDTAEGTPDVATPAA